MLSVGLSSSAVIPYLDRVSAEFRHVKVTTACINSPGNVTISGEAVHLDRLEAILQQDKIFTRKLNVSLGYHSPQMQKIAEQYLACMGTLSARKLKTKAPVMISSVTGAPVTAEAVSQPQYWVQNMVQPVLFSDAVDFLCSRIATRKAKKLDGSHRTHVSVKQLVEIGPHSALQGPTREILRSTGHEDDIGYVSVLKRHVSAVNSTLAAIGKLHCIGYPVNLAAVNDQAMTKVPVAPARVPLADLPEYPFNHGKKYWHESRLSKDSRLRRFGRMDLLGTPSSDWNPLEPKWRNIIRTSELPWVEDHKVGSSNETLSTSQGEKY